MVLFASVFASAMVASAQESAATPQVEVGVNYSYTRVNPGSGFGSYNANGGFGDVEYNFTKNLGIVADLGANYTGTANGFAVNNTSFEYLFGPRFNLRYARFNPYVQALFGGQRLSNGWNPANFDPRTGTSQNNFAMAFGGGVNIPLNEHISLRPVQVEYFATRITPDSSNYLQNDVRYSAGVVLRLGSK
jgi:hypothetical protein